MNWIIFLFSKNKKNISKLTTVFSNSLLIKVCQIDQKAIKTQDHNPLTIKDYTNQMYISSRSNKQLNLNFNKNCPQNQRHNNKKPNYLNFNMPKVRSSSICDNRKWINLQWDLLYFKIHPNPHFLKLKSFHFWTRKRRRKIDKDNLRGNKKNSEN